MKTYTSWGFSEEAIRFIDRLCRVSDGAGIEKYTLYQFLEAFDQSIFYKVYQPRKPNDDPEGLIGMWEKALHNVTIVKNAQITSSSSDTSFQFSNKSEQILADQYYLCVPPLEAYKLVPHLGVHYEDFGI